MRIVSVLFVGTKECTAPTPAQSQNQNLFNWVQDKEKSLSSLLEDTTFPEGNSRTRITLLHRLNRCALGELTRGEASLAQLSRQPKVVLLCPRGGRL